MWECPDFFSLDGKWVLLTSPQDMMPEGFEYHNGNGTLCLIGDFDEQTGEFKIEHDQSIVLTPDGRRVMIGWMQNWDACAIREPEAKWACQMSLPRELFLKDGRLFQRPSREIDDIRYGEISYDKIHLNGNRSFEGINGRVLDMELVIEPAPEKDMYHRFAVWFAMDDTFHTTVSYRPHEQTLKIDRKFSGSRRAIIHQRRAKVQTKDGTLKLRMILDRYSVEIFVNDGEKVLSAGLYTPLEADRISFLVDGDAVLSIRKWNLES